MVGQRTLSFSVFLAVLALAWPGWAQEESPPAEVEQAVDEESASAAGEAAPEVVSLPPAPSPYQIRKAPGRAIRASEIENRTVQLSRMLDASEDRLRQLSGRVLSGKMGRAGAIVVFQNEMGSSFKLIKAVFALDGAPIFSRIDESGGLGEREEIELINGSIVPGEHKISVSLEYRGHGYGIFSYLKGYRFKVRSSYTFNAQENKLARVRVVGYEKGDQNTPLEERPDVRYVERTEALPASGTIAPASDREE